MPPADAPAAAWRGPSDERPPPGESPPPPRDERDAQPPIGAPSPRAGQQGHRRRDRPDADGGAGAGGGGAAGRDALAKGEAMIREGRIAEDRGQLKDAWGSYRKGLRKVIEVLQRLPEDDPRTTQIRHLVTEYLERAEKVKSKLDSLA